MSPTQRSLKLLRDRNWLVAIVEKWNPYVKIRQDLFGFGDLLAVRGDEVLIVQCCRGADLSTRVKKIQAEPRAKVWLASIYRQIVVHGWRKVGARGKRKVWECREETLTL